MEGMIMQGDGRVDTGCVALHSCRRDSNNDYWGGVRVHKVDDRHAYMRCEVCGMRVAVPPETKSWQDLVNYFERDTGH